MPKKTNENTPLLLIVGGGAYQGTLQKIIEDLGVQPYVQLVGAIPHGQLSWYYNAADLVCLMSEREGWPNVVLEALACGRPVMASRVGGIPEILTSPKVGILVERHVPQLVLCMAEALEQDWNVLEIVGHAKTFNWTQTAQSVEGVLKSVVQQQRVA